jgi:ribosomal protein S18 acetylase RimI-like enzyme
VWRLSNLLEHRDGSARANRTPLATSTASSDAATASRDAANASLNPPAEPPRQTFTCRPTHDYETRVALQLILGNVEQPASEEQIVDFLRFAVYRGIRLNDLWVAEYRARIVWAVLPVVSPGRTMLLFSPTHVPLTLMDTCARPLVEKILEEFRARRNVHLAQVLLDPNEVPALRLFEACGFERLAELIYLHRDIRRAARPALPPGFCFRTYSPGTHGDFSRAIAASYERSLDCPGLNGRREMDDVIAGHQASGEFDPKLWFVLCEREAPVGVLLLNRSPRTEAVELVYLGLAPAARRRGLGNLLMQQALCAAAESGSRRMTLAVDACNTPALRLYHRHGLRRICSRLALIKDLRCQESSP